MTHLMKIRNTLNNTKNKIYMKKLKNTRHDNNMGNRRLYSLLIKYLQKIPDYLK